MHTTKSDTHRKVGGAKPRPDGVRKLNLSRFALVIDPHTRAQGGASASDPDELSPPCPRCRSTLSTLWFIDRRTRLPELVCLECTPHVADPGDTHPNGR